MNLARTRLPLGRRYRVGFDQQLKIFYRRQLVRFEYRGEGLGVWQKVLHRCWTYKYLFKPVQGFTYQLVGSGYCRGGGTRRATYPQMGFQSGLGGSVGLLAIPLLTRSASSLLLWVDAKEM